MSNIETLKAWTRWKESQPDLDENGRQLIKAVKDMISQLGTYRADLERASHDLTVLLAQNVDLSMALQALSKPENAPVRPASPESSVKFLLEKNAELRDERNILSESCEKMTNILKILDRHFNSVMGLATAVEALPDFKWDLNPHYFQKLITFPKDMIRRGLE